MRISKAANTRVFIARHVQRGEECRGRGAGGHIKIPGRFSGDRVKVADLCRFSFSASPHSRDFLPVFRNVLSYVNILSYTENNTLEDQGSSKLIKSWRTENLSDYNEYFGLLQARCEGGVLILL